MLLVEKPADGRGDDRVARGVDRDAEDLEACAGREGVARAVGREFDRGWIERCGVERGCTERGCTERGCERDELDRVTELGRFCRARVIADDGFERGVGFRRSTFGRRPGNR